MSENTENVKITENSHLAPLQTEVEVARAAFVNSINELNLRAPRDAWTGSARRTPDLSGPIEVPALDPAKSDV